MGLICIPWQLRGVVCGYVTAAVGLDLLTCAQVPACRISIGNVIMRDAIAHRDDDVSLSRLQMDLAVRINAVICLFTESFPQSVQAAVPPHHCLNSLLQAYNQPIQAKRYFMVLIRFGAPEVWPTANSNNIFGM